MARAVTLSLVLLSCNGTSPAVGKVDTTPAPRPTVVIYCGRSASLVGPLFEAAEKALHIDIQAEYGDTAEVVTRALTEGAEGHADLLFAQESGFLEVLDRAGWLAPMPDEVLSEAGKRFRDPEGHWVGTSGRLRVLVYNPDRVRAEDLPRRLQDLAQPRWTSHLGWSPPNASFQAQVGVLRHAWGEDPTRKWLTDLRDGGARSFPKNAPIVEAVASGSLDIGLVNHYYLHELKAQHPEGFAARNASFEPGDVGNQLMISGVGLRAGSPHAEPAILLTRWLLSTEAQTWFSQHTFEYPVRADVPLHPDIPPLSSVALAPMEASWTADLGPTRAMLQELGLQ